MRGLYPKYIAVAKMERRSRGGVSWTFGVLGEVCGDAVGAWGNEGVRGCVGVGKSCGGIFRVGYGE
jgi:hypothetical protein